MILTPGVPGVAFGTAADGDGRNDPSVRALIASELGISHHWAYVDQVHGSAIVDVSDAGNHGPADGMSTSVADLPLAIGTADCVPVALVGDGTVAMLHAGWRGVAAGIVLRALADIAVSTYTTAVIGPRIGSCCYEVNSDVIEAVGGFEATTRRGTTSVDLGAAIVAQIDGRLPVLDVPYCTRCDERFASHRRNGTKVRQVSLAWL
jgi:purine-nucleoside/S-methyl-5'-thioadenosine phosphorylase / adenosine deaminase